jgi:hypothetical protein
MPHLQKYMRRLPKTHKKRPMSKKDEPDFKALNKATPLPALEDAPIPGKMFSIPSAVSKIQRDSPVLALQGQQHVPQMVTLPNPRGMPAGPSLGAQNPMVSRYGGTMRFPQEVNFQENYNEPLVSSHSHLTQGRLTQAHHGGMGHSGMHHQSAMSQMAAQQGMHPSAIVPTQANSMMMAPSGYGGYGGTRTPILTNHDMDPMRLQHHGMEQVYMNLGSAYDAPSAGLYSPYAGHRSLHSVVQSLRGATIPPPLDCTIPARGNDVPSTRFYNP